MFGSALELPVDQREAFVAEACAEDDAMVGEVRALLAADEGAGGLMRAGSGWACIGFSDSEEGSIPIVDLGLFCWLD